MTPIRQIFTQLVLAYLLFLLFLLGFIPFLIQAEPVTHQVEKGDTLYGLSLSYQVSMEDLKEANNLDRDMLIEGEILKIPVAHPGTYLVKPGDTLSGIALATGNDMDALGALNRITPEELKAGMILELIRPPLKNETWTVREGDTLSWISLKFNLSVERLKQINSLGEPYLHPGQILDLTDPRPQTVTVGPGDSLWKYSNRYNITMKSLQEWNNLQDENIRVGQTLQLYPLVLEEETTEEESAGPQEAETVIPEVRLAALNYSPPLYYALPTRKRTQPDSLYAEEDLESPLANYRKARELLNDFDRAIETLPSLGHSLEGYRIVIDPGHGGVDPGAIVENRDGRGNTVYVVEDEYCYDIALRVYKDLKRHGAEVFLTVLSPNHTIRQSPDASLTFVNEKNEVWNNESYNRTNLPSSWPVGTRTGLNRRVEMAEDFYGSHDRDKTLFISIHADNQPYAGEGSIVVYHPEAAGTESQEMADFMTAYLGMGSYTHPQELRVLSENPAGAAVLVEIRNLSYPNNSWAIRNEELRQDDADRIVRALTSYAMKLR